LQRCEGFLYFQFMNASSLKGHWTGEFSYGRSYEEWYGTKERFEITIEQSDMNGFTGRCVDTESITGQYIRTAIKGFFDQGFISFTKEYDHYYEMGQDGKTIFDTSKKGHTVNYQGEFNESLDRFEGTWEIHYHFQLLWITWWTKTLEGTWEMYKTE
jgi:hypothetical protein